MSWIKRLAGVLAVAAVAYALWTWYGGRSEHPSTAGDQATGG